MNMLESLRTYLTYPFVQYALLTGMLIALCSSLLGVTLVLKRFSLIGDGLSHVAFGALAIATVLKMTAPMLVALPVTIVCAVCLLCAGSNSRIRGDAFIAMLSVGSLAIGYLTMNTFGASANVSGDVCSTLFGSTSILTLRPLDVWLCVILSAAVVLFFILFYERVFAMAFDETFARATGQPVGFFNLVFAIVVAIVIVLSMNLVGSLLISALIVLPALAAMRICRSFLGVTICAAILSLVCALGGMLVAIVAGTPVGSTIVTADLLAFLLCALGAWAVKRYALARTALALLCVVSLALCGCGKKEKPVEQPEPAPKQEVKVDLDLTTLNPMMVYTQVFYMIQKPQDYAGQMIRLKGACTVTKNRQTQERHYNCSVSDSTGCCSTMIRFTPAKECLSLPRTGDAITVIGRFALVTEGTKTIGVLQDATLE